MAELNFPSWLSHQETAYAEGLGTVLRSAGNGLSAGMNWLDRLLTSAPAIAKDILSAYRNKNTVTQDLISNRQALQAVKNLGRLNQGQVEQEAYDVLSQKENEAALLALWGKQTLNLQKALGAVVYLGDLLHIAPFFRSTPVQWESFAQSVKTIATAPTPARKCAAIVVAAGGLVKLLHFIAAGGNVTGIWAKLALLSGQMELGGYLLGMCYVGWGLIFVLQLAKGHTSTSVLQGAIGALLRLINPVEDKKTEATLYDLRQSAVNAFPGTRRRQHALGPVSISELTWTPFLGLRTLFVRATARNEDRLYRPMVLFKDVHYVGEGGIPLFGRDQRIYRLQPLTDKEVLLRCDCKDFSYRFNYYNSLARSLYRQGLGTVEGKSSEI